VILVARLKNFMGNVSHNSWRRLVLSFQKDGRWWTKGNYMKLVKRKKKQAKKNLLGVGEAKF
jgi:hypothetical protein